MLSYNDLHKISLKMFHVQLSRMVLCSCPVNDSSAIARACGGESRGRDRDAESSRILPGSSAEWTGDGVTLGRARDSDQPLERRRLRRGRSVEPRRIGGRAEPILEPNRLRISPIAFMPGWLRPAANDCRRDCSSGEPAGSLSGGEGARIRGRHSFNDRAPASLDRADPPLIGSPQTTAP